MTSRMDARAWDMTTRQQISNATVGEAVISGMK
jgi:hypothetical protein